jgi:hypothetical protein
MAGVTYAGADDTVPPSSLMPDSMFNQAVTNWPVDPNSAAIVAEFNQDWQQNYGNVGVNDRPVIWVPPDQPLVPVSIQSGCDNFVANTGAEAPIPPWAVTSGPSDYLTTLYQPSSQTVWEFWSLHKVATASGGSPIGISAYSGWSACWGGKADLATFTGVFPAPYGATATGISNLATEVTEQDILSGSIDHAIGLQVVNCDQSVYPANRSDCSTDLNTPAEGQWFRFSPSVNCADYTSTKFENLVCAAGKTYGFVVVDRAGSDGIEADYGSGTWDLEGNTGDVAYWQNGGPRGCCVLEGGGDPLMVSMETVAGNESSEAQEYTVIGGLPWSQLQVIDPPQPVQPGGASLAAARAPAAH